MSQATHQLELRAVGYDHPDAVALTEAVQQEYVVRYGGPDHTPMEPDAFVPPTGLFVVGYLGDTPVATGGWRARGSAEAGCQDGDAEIKRMYVVDAARGRGFARAMLAHLEYTASAAGRLRIVLETGTEQPEAIALYLSAGYHRIPDFGFHAHLELSRCYAKPLGETPCGPSLSGRCSVDADLRPR
jgi:GNAT superfamily N-acetyltransferase